MKNNRWGRLIASIMAAVVLTTSVPELGMTTYAMESMELEAENTSELSDGAVLAETEEIASEYKEGAVSGNDKTNELSKEDPQTGESPAENSPADDVSANDVFPEDSILNTVSSNDVSGNDISGNNMETELITVSAQMKGVFQCGALTNFPVKTDIPSLMSIEGGQQSLNEYLLENYQDRNENIDLEAYNVYVEDLDYLENEMALVINDNPALFYLTDQYTYTYDAATEQILYVSPEILPLSANVYEDAVATALKSIKPGMTTVEKYMALHDYLVNNVAYDKENLMKGTLPSSVYTAYGALVNRSAVCNGYALAYNDLCSRLGLYSERVTSDAMNHAWNLVKVGSSYYHVDTTWDDPTYNHVGRVGHDFFLVSDNAMLYERRSRHYNWSATKKAQSNIYDNAWWVDIESPILYKESGSYYYVSEQRISYSTGFPLVLGTQQSITSISTEQITTIPGWPYPGGGQYTTPCSGLFMMDEKLYYNTYDKIYSIYPDGSEKFVEYETDTTDGKSIYGISLEKGAVHMAYRPAWNATNKKESDPVVISVKKLYGYKEVSLPLVQPDVGTYGQGTVGEYTVDKGTTVKIIAWAGDNRASTIYYTTDGSNPEPGNAKTFLYTAPFTVDKTMTVKAIGMHKGYHTSGIGTQKLTVCSVYFALSESNITLLPGQTVTLTAAVLPDRAKAENIIWSSEPGKVTCDKGKVTIKDNATGSTTVYADVPDHKGKLQRASCLIQIKQPEYNVSFKDYDSTVWAETVVEKGNKVAAPATPDRAHYEFTGWYTSPSQMTEATKWDFDSNTVTADLTLYAGYEIKKYTVNYNSVIGIPMEQSVFHIPYGSKAQEIILAKDGYEFTGWYTSAIQKDETTKWDFKRDIVTNNMALFAGWIEPRQVEFIVDNMYYAKQDFVAGDALTAPKDPQKDGYSFTGWYTSATEQTAATRYDFTSAGERNNLKLYAGWSEERMVLAPYAGVENGTVILVDSKLRLYCDTPDATIYYTFDKTKKNNPDILYEDGIRISQNPERQLYAIARKEGYADSRIASIWINLDHDLYGDVLTEDRPASGEYPDGLWIAGLDADGYTYTGSAIKPEMRVYYKKRLLQEKTDYTVAYKNNVNANDASKTNTAPQITITGKGNYSGKIVTTFKINQLDFSDEKYSSWDNTFVTNNLVVVYNKNLQKANPEVKWNGKALKAGKDYKITRTDTASTAYKMPGTYDVKIDGIGNFKGTRWGKIQIVQKTLMSKVSVSGVKKKSWTGSPVTQELVVKNGSKVLHENEHYTLKYLNNVNAGTATIQITGIEANGYIGTKTVTFAIAGTSIKKAKIMNWKANMPYSGEPVTQDFSLIMGEQVLAEGVNVPNSQDGDYVAVYTNNVKAGTATVTITGRGKYTDSVKKTFKIDKIQLKNNPELTITGKNLNMIPYAKGGCVPEVEVSVAGMKLIKGTDYKVSYKENKAVGKTDAKQPRIVVTGCGNYAGDAWIPFTIVQQNLNEVKMTAPDKVYSSKKGGYKSAPVLTDVDGKALKLNTDYADITYRYDHDTTLVNGDVRLAGELVNVEDIIPAGTTLCVGVVGKNCYYGKQSARFRIVQASITSAKVTVDSAVYTGKMISPDKSAITVKLGKDITLQADDYDIISYKNNIARGNATLVIQGKGSYGGLKTVTFTISNKSMNYTIVYDKNAEGVTGVMKDSSLCAGTKLAAVKYKRAGYTFAGWNTKADGSGVSYANAEAFYRKDSRAGVYGETITLYAMWVPTQNAARK